MIVKAASFALSLIVLVLALVTAPSWLGLVLIDYLLRPKPDQPAWNGTRKELENFVTGLLWLVGVLTVLSMSWLLIFMLAAS